MDLFQREQVERDKLKKTVFTEQSKQRGGSGLGRIPTPVSVVLFLVLGDNRTHLPFHMVLLPSSSMATISVQATVRLARE